ncbi:MAG: 30S ribosomal protein S3 [Candidatus Omnitrophota bacterium]|nr:30S ribosomal protein S3 [Candidatus Omnitrophota bacterium]
MGQKVHPISFRIGVIRDWNSRWYANKEEYPEKLLQDAKVRKLVEKELSRAMVSHIDIERASNRVRVMIYSGRPGIVIGRRGGQIEMLKEQIQNIVGDQSKLFVDIKEVPNPAFDAKIVADSIAFQLVKRIAFRRAMKKAIQSLKDAGGEGIKIKCSGRLGGAEIARSEGYKWGKIPLQTIRADIDYGFTEARTAYGIIGVKVWIYKGEKFDTRPKTKKAEEDRESGSEKAETKTEE